MRFQTQWLRRVVGVFTLTTTLFSIPATNTFAQASLFDPTFNVGAGANGSVNAILVQDDGKILVGGEFTQIAGQARTNLARLSSDGQLDASFPQGTDGFVYRFLEQFDGKILVAGAFTNLQGVARRGIGRLLTNGTVDVGFDPGSVLEPYDAGVSLALQSDNKILVGTATFPFTNSALFRLNPNGHLDETFIQTNRLNPNHTFAIYPRTNGSILLGGGFQEINGISSPGLALLKTNGELDLSFGSPLEASSYHDYSRVYSIIPMPDGSIVIGGKFWQQGSTNQAAVAKLTSHLGWDSSFQPDAFDNNVFTPNHGTVISTILQPDGKIVCGGVFQEVGGYWRKNIVRLDFQGHVDPCFDPGIGLTGFVSWTLALAGQTNGSILAGGNFVGDLSYTNMVRLLPQSDCDNMRVYLRMLQDGNFIAAATFPPGGTNTLQVSSNLVDWIDHDVSTRPYLIFPWYYPSPPIPISSVPQIFFRGKKQY